jgi:hypothetical protein
MPWRRDNQAMDSHRIEVNRQRAEAWLRQDPEVSIHRGDGKYFYDPAESYNSNVGEALKCAALAVPFSETLRFVRETPATAANRRVYAEWLATAVAIDTFVGPLCAVQAVVHTLRAWSHLTRM